MKILQALSRLNASWKPPKFEKNTLTVNERSQLESSESAEINAARDRVAETLESKKKSPPTVKAVVVPIERQVPTPVAFILDGDMPTPPPPPQTQPAAKDANGELLQHKIPYKMKHRFDATKYKAVRRTHLK